MACELTYVSIIGINSSHYQAESEYMRKEIVQITLIGLFSVWDI